MVKHVTGFEIDKDGATVLVNRNQQCALFVQINGSNIFAMLVFKRERFVVDLVKHADPIPHR